MKSPNAISFKDIHSETRIGPDLKRASKEDGLLKLEAEFESVTPLPITYDVKPIQTPYFSEFTYFDFLKDGVLFESMNNEVNARIMEQSVNTGSNDKEILKTILDNFNDKYNLISEVSNKKLKKIVFLPGSNLRHLVDRSKLDRILFHNPEFMLKPHPITTPEALKDLGNLYGWHRIIDPNESGYSYLKQADVVITTANSELSLVANMMNKQWIDVTHSNHLRECPYGSMNLFFQEMNSEYNRDIMARIFNAKDSGIVFSWQDDSKERMCLYIDSVMKIREFFRPRFPGK